ncbi:hypothetical protein M501DRAFT_933265, partial [Patellaria atrata CBS 101060]
VSPISPEVQNFDSPFPVFPSQKQNPHKEQYAIDDGMAGLNLEDYRIPDEAPRPGTAGRTRATPQRQPIPPPQQQWREPPRPSQRQMRGGYQNMPGGNRPRPGPPSPSHAAFGPNSQRSMTMPHSRPHGQGFRPEPPAQWTEPGPAAGYHGPESPSYIPPRPSTSSSNRHQGLTNQNRGYNDGLPESQSSHPPRAYDQNNARRGSLDDVYDTYYDNQAPVAQQRQIFPPVTREVQIEAEMPNFELQASSRPMHQKQDAVPVAQLGSGDSYNDYHGQTQNSEPNQKEFVFEMPGDMPAILPVQRMNPGHMERNNDPYSHGDGRKTAPPVAQEQGYSPHPNQQFYKPGYPQMHRNASGHSQRSDPGPRPQGDGRMGLQQEMVQRTPSANQGQGLQQGTMQRNLSTNQGQGLPHNGRPGLPQARRSNPDALPQHPTPVRPGLMESNSGGNSRPPPVRQYATDPPLSRQATMQSSAPANSKPSAERRVSGPVTQQELDNLRPLVKSGSADNKTQLKYAKKLIEAADVLTRTMEQRSAAKARERFILDAHKVIKKLVSNGYPDAMFYLADCYGQGLLGLAVDNKEAFKLYQSAAKGGHAQGAYRTAVCCEMGSEEGGGTHKDPLKAVQWYKRAAALGDVSAMYKMGMILLKGLLGQQRNLGDALTWLKRAAERADEDNPHALHELGTLYESPVQNDKIIRDEAYAFSLFKQAADLGYKHSQFRVAEAYEHGLFGCPVDARASIAWYSKAAAQEEHNSGLALSGWYLTGAQGILEQSDTEAYLWARKAACANPPLAKAMFAMGYFTETGIGCPRSLEEAKRWYGRAAAYDFPKAKERLEELKRGGAKAQKSRERLSRTNQKQNEENCVIM